MEYAEVYTGRQAGALGVEGRGARNMADTRVQPVIAAQDCRNLLERIIASKEFRRAHRLREFLAYVVDRKLAGASHELTEVLIGQRVFGRASTYNPAEDSIVRTEARNLRQRLDRYFAGEGSDEPIVLEIPKGGYVPVFRFRTLVSPPEAPAATPTPLLRSRRFWLLNGAAALLAGAALWRRPVSRPGAPAAPAIDPGRALGLVEFDASDPQLVKGLEWAKQRALGYAYSGDGVGDWYDSTAGNRYAFCMRDTSHQSTGAAVLGLAGYTRNMLRRLAGSISETRDWCGYWEINKDGFPAPIDYQDDAHFWYCLPASFDVMQACYRQFLWTGDRTYFDVVFSNFYDRTVTSYIDAWDRDHDGLMESSPAAGRRGIPSYYQHLPRPLTGADLVAAQYRGYLTYAAIQQHKGVRGSLSEKLSDQYLAKAQALRVRFNNDWWNGAKNRFYPAILPDRSYYDGLIDGIDAHVLWFGITEDGLKTDATLDLLEKNRSSYPQILSYLPGILFEHGRYDAAYRILLEIMDAGFASRGMPELVYAAIGAVATGLAGISPDAPGGSIATLPRLPKALAWIKLSRVPLLRNEISLLHRGVAETTVTNQAGPPFQWRVRFPAGQPSGRIAVDGVLVRTDADGRFVSAVVPVGSGQTRVARCLSGT